MTIELAQGLQCAVMASGDGCITVETHSKPPGPTPRNGTGAMILSNELLCKKEDLNLDFQDLCKTSHHCECWHTLGGGNRDKSV